MAKIKLFCILLISWMFMDVCLASIPENLIVTIEDTDSFPFYRKANNPGKTHPGIFIEFAKILEREMNIKLTIRRLPWKRSLQELKRGEVHGILTASYAPEREKIGRYPQKDGKVDPSRRFSSSSYYLYTKTNSPIEWDGKTIKNVFGHIGAQRGFSVASDLRAMGLKVEEVTNIEAIFRMLKNDRLVAVAAHKESGDVLMHQYSKLKRLKRPLSTKPYYFLLSHPFYRSNPEFSERLWDMSTKIRKSNELKEIYEKYEALERWPDE